MAEARNCPTCGEIFNFTGLREVCATCAAKEEKLYEDVYRFLRKRENRAANIERIVEVTGVTESLLHQWVRKGRLQPALFPNLGYPCDKCGALTTTGKLCDSCTEEIKRELSVHDAATELREALAEKERGTYYAQRKK
ncbi:hypothetical protein DV702_01035 [Sporosarcina sp. PTS2304]|uniref:TIGR03826 family flagellar region protein n=1 Tax=Sporosarcina sp. PTS2304 TaxID=2283194 RepID=UPI000E0D0613|nr:TIGR03826 family flagellar region protein [Sporosarcina sp. PTS2304]AXI01235.1 hypothetical protein DV702_01035 [Sporosarcina sp. PTS2304]